MFGTFRFRGSLDEEPEVFKPQGSTQIDARGYTLVACDTCRARKLKCSGDKDCCKRCRSAGAACTYTQSSGPGGGKRRTRRGSATPSRSEDRTARADSNKANSEASEPTRQRPRSEGQRSPSHAKAGSGGGDAMLPGPAWQQHPDNPPDVTAELSSELASAGAVAAWPNLSLEDFVNDLLDPSRLASDTSFEYDTGFRTSISDISDNAVPSPLGDPSQQQQQQAQGYPHAAATTEVKEMMALADSAHAEWELCGPGSLGLEPGSLATAAQGGGHCECLGTMVRLLEEIGVQRAGAAGTGADTLLLCLQVGVRSCREALGCTQCNLCCDSSMLMATVAQQLRALCHDIVDLVRRYSDAAAAPSGHGDVLEGAIWFGRYSIEAPAIRASITYRLVALHLAELRAFLGQLRDRISQKRGAWKLVSEQEEKTARMCMALEELDSPLEGSSG